ncbi:MAG TPA: EcsC family protein [Candidatus Methylomirabilis sp.]|nr:EcsC family protein [Candidatus Methylomirabilis sp.]
MTEEMGSKLDGWSVNDLLDLRKAKELLEYPGLAARIASLVGMPIESGFKYLPDNWQKKVAEATREALLKGLELAIHTMSDSSRKFSRDFMHKLIVTASGAGGGAFGLPALPLELPFSTCVILRSIADIAQSEGHKISSLETRLSCVFVLALGGKKSGDDATDTGYWATRVALGRAVSEAAAYLAERGLAEEGAPPLVRLLLVIAERFGLIVGEEVAAKAIPVIGAVAGAAVNYAFMSHFQDMARGHFIVRRLEEKYGTDEVQRVYDGLGI